MSIDGWLWTVARNAWCDFVQHRRRQRVGRGSGGSHGIERLETLEAREDLIQRLDEEFDRELLDQAMARVQSRVQPRTWEAFRLLALERWSGAEVAATLGMKVAAVFVARSNVPKLLQEEVRRLDRPQRIAPGPGWDDRFAISARH